MGSPSSSNGNGCSTYVNSKSMSLTQQVMELRALTGAGIVDCKQALEDAGGDREKAILILKKKGVLKAAKKSAERTTAEGVIATYVHHTKKLAAMVEVQCETDFVARNAEFVEFANDIAMQVAAMNPDYLSPEAVPEDVIAIQKDIFLAEIAGEQKSDDVKAKIIDGKLQKWFAEVCLMKQSFFKREEITMEDYINEKIAKMGEKIVMSRYVRYELPR